MAVDVRVGARVFVGVRERVAVGTMVRVGEAGSVSDGTRDGAAVEVVQALRSRPTARRSKNHFRKVPCSTHLMIANHAGGKMRIILFRTSASA